MTSTLRGNRDFVALWVGQAVSNLGISISAFAYPLVVLAATGSALEAGAVGSVLATTSFVLRLPAGAFVDRWDRRRIMIACDAGRIVNAAAFGVAIALNRFHFAHVLVVAFVEAALGVLFGPAEAAAVRRVVQPEQRREAVAANAGRTQLPGLAGPPLGGVLLSAGRSLPFFADAISYAVSLACVLSVRADLRTRRTATTGRPVAEMLHGVRWILRDRFLRALLTLFMAFGLTLGAMGLVVLVLAREHGAGSAEIGAMFTITAAGGALGAMLTPRLVRALTPFTLIALAVWLSTLATVSLAVLDEPLAYGLAGAVPFFFVGPLNALAFGIVAAEAPDELQGRVTSGAIQLSTLGAPLAPLVAGVLLTHLGSGTTVLVYAGASALFAATATFSRDLRSTPQHPAAASS